VWAISNSTSGATASQIESLLEIGTIEALASLLVIPDPRTLAITLEGLENLLKKANDFYKGVFFIHIFIL